MRNYNIWKLSHLLSVFAHVFLWFAGVIAFVTEPISLSSPESHATFPAGASAIVSSLRHDVHSYSSPESNKTLPWGGSAIAMFGGALISILFAFMCGAQKPCNESNQDRDRDFNIKLIFVVSMVAQVFLGALDITIAVFTATKTRDRGAALTAFGALAAIAGFITFGTVIADIIHLRGLYTQTYPTDIFNMQLLKIDEDV